MNTYKYYKIIVDSERPRRNLRDYRVSKHYKELLKEGKEEIEEKKRKIYEEINNGRSEKYPILRYKNYSRKSGVYAYAISPDKRIIYVYFIGKKRALYKYDVESASSFEIREMVKRAKSGWGLNRYINKHEPGYYYRGKY